MVGVNRYCDF